jgi:transketolase
VFAQPAAAPDTISTPGIGESLMIDSRKKVMGPLSEEWRAFGWSVRDIDGHDMEQILDAFAAARETVGKPTLILARTVKGKGVSFMENNLEFHGMAPTAEQLTVALAELK